MVSISFFYTQQSCSLLGAYFEIHNDPIFHYYLISKFSANYTLH